MKHIILLPNYMESEKMLKEPGSFAHAETCQRCNCMSRGDTRLPCPLKVSEELFACCFGHGGHWTHDTMFLRDWTA